MQQINGLPWSDEAERQVIGSMLVNSSTADTIQTECRLRADDFFSTPNRQLFEVICKLHDNGKAVNFLSVCIALKIAEGSKEAEYVKNIMSVISTTKAAAYYAGIIKDMAQRRRYIMIAEDIKKACSDTSRTLDEADSEIERLFDKEDNTGETYTGAELFTAAYSDICDRYSRKGAIPGVKTGWKRLDGKLGGLEGGELIIIGGRPGMGKSIIAQNIAENIVFRENMAVLYFSLEMPGKQVARRMMSSLSGVYAKKAKFGKLNEADFEALSKAISIQNSDKLYINDRSMIDISYIKSVSRSIARKEQNNVGAIIIDYLQLMRFSGNNWSKTDAIGEVTRSLKMLAKELDVPIVCLSQLSRANEREKDKRPILADLRESGAIEQDADKVLLLYRDEYYNRDTPDKGIIEVIIAKNRDGENGTVKLDWKPNTMRIATPEEFRDVQSDYNPFEKGKQVSIGG